jgi:hypothetical protein
MLELDRRQFLSTVAVSAAAVAIPRAYAAPAAGVRPRLLARAQAALDHHHSRIPHRDFVALVDFSAPSRSPRFHLVDLGNGKAVSTLLVAHGRGSDPANSGWVKLLSNQPDSNASSGGSFVTGSTYMGKHGRSRRLVGLDRENSMAAARGIIIHAASYVDAELVRSQGRIGRSQGCFAVCPDAIAPVLTRLPAGRLLFAMR